MELIAKLLLGGSALISVWFMIAGLMDMQRVNTADSEVLELQGVVRQLTPHGRFDMLAVLTLNADDDVQHVDCLLPGAWFGRRRRQVTDVVRVFWRRGEKRAVAAQTILDGQRMFILGVCALALCALIYVLLF